MCKDGNQPVEVPEITQSAIFIQDPYNLLDLALYCFVVFCFVFLVGDTPGSAQGLNLDKPCVKQLPYPVY